MTSWQASSVHLGRGHVPLSPRGSRRGGGTVTVIPANTFTFNNYSTKGNTSVKADFFILRG